MDTDFQKLLDEAYPPSADAPVIRGVMEGILLADKTLENEPFLASLVGKDLRGHIRRAGILFRLDELAKKGDVPFTSTMAVMPRGNWHWIELKSKKFTAHVCRTDGPDLFPVDTPTRQDERLTNQSDLFFDASNVEPIAGYVAWLTFGIGDSGSLGHLCWGMPNSSEDIWLARTNIIQRASRAALVIKPEKPSTPLDLKFKDHVEASLKGKKPTSDNKK